MYGMYQGVEIQHPLYSALFMILVASWVLSLINIVGFPFQPSLAHAKLTNIGSNCIPFNLTDPADVTYNRISGNDLATSNGSIIPQESDNRISGSEWDINFVPPVPKSINNLQAYL